MKKLLLALVLITAQIAASAQTKWNVDKSHSNVKFSVEHLVISEVDGSFRTFNGGITSSKPDFSDASIDFTIDINSIDTEDQRRDGHLKGEDFFNAAKYPEMKFKSTSFKKKSGNTYVLIGNLTIRDVTKAVTFNVVYGGTAKDGYGNIKSGFKASTTIDRFDYGLKWNALTEAGGATVGKDVQIKMNLQFAQAK